MKSRTACLLAATVVLLPQRIGAQSETMSDWELTVSTVLGHQKYSVAPKGGKVPDTGFTNCQQEPVRLFKDRAGQLQEQVRVACDTGLGGKAILIENCYALRPEENWGAMRIESGLSPFTISLKCRTL